MRLRGFGLASTPVEIITSSLTSLDTPYAKQVEPEGLMHLRKIHLIVPNAWIQECVDNISDELRPNSHRDQYHGPSFQSVYILV